MLPGKCDGPLLAPTTAGALTPLLARVAVPFLMPSLGTFRVVTQTVDVDLTTSPTRTTAWRAAPRTRSPASSGGRIRPRAEDALFPTRRCCAPPRPATPSPTPRAPGGREQRRVGGPHPLQHRDGRAHLHALPRRHRDDNPRPAARVQLLLPGLLDCGVAVNTAARTAEVLRKAKRRGNRWPCRRGSGPRPPRAPA